MTNLDFEKQLTNALHQTSSAADSRHLEATLLLARKEAVQKKYHERISFLHFLSRQIRYIGWKIWGVQVALLLLFGHMIASLCGLYFWEAPHSLAKFLMCLSILVVMTALPFLYRIVQYRMHEIEAATYFSSAKLLLAKLIVIGIGDVLLLTGILVVALFATSLQTGNASFYIFVPFLFTSGVCLFMLGHFSAKQFFAGSMGLCFLLIFLTIALPGRFGLLFSQTFTFGWALICMALVLFCAAQIHYILHRCPYAEMQLERIS